MLKEKVMRKKIEITKDMTLAEVLNYKKDAGTILMGFGMHCFACPAAQMESLEEAASVHGIDIDLLIKKLNER